MKLTPDPFTFICQRNELIRVDIHSTGTTHAVVYELDGISKPLSLDQSLNFTLIHDPTLLTLSFSFSNPQGGVYVIRIMGSGEVSEYTLKQTPNPGRHAILTYRFQVEGGRAHDLGGEETKQGY